MNKKRLTILLGASLLIGGLLYAQVPFGKGEEKGPKEKSSQSETLRLARKIYREMTSTEREEICSMDYTITTVDQTYENLDTSVTSVRYLAGRNRVHYRSAEMSFFQDQSVALALVPERKTLFLARSSMEAIRKKQQGVFALLQDSLFNNATVISDAPLSEGRSNRILVLEAGDGMRFRFRIDRVTLKLNTETESMQEIRVDFLSGSPLRSATMTYEKMEWLKSTPEFDHPITEIAFAANGKLLPEYEGYMVIDKRGEE